MYLKSTNDFHARTRCRNCQRTKPVLYARHLRANKAAAAARDAGLVDILTEIGWEQPYRDIAEQLTERGVPTPRGGDTWNAMTERNILKRLGLRGDG